jgi:hypothetical protein
MRSEAKSQAQKSHARYYQRRRQFSDEILFGQDMTPIQKVYGLAVAQVASRIADDEDSIAGRSTRPIRAWPISRSGLVLTHA